MPTDSTGPHVLHPGRAPTPFTADEIRDGCPPGRTIRLLVEPEGMEPFLRTNRYVRCDAEGATIEKTRLTVDGVPLGPATADRTTWLELQAHASFPADQTDIAVETIETPLGALECQRYRVDDGSTIATFWFARSAPGMPIRFRTEEAGRITNVVTMIADTSG